MKKRLASILLALMILISLLPAAALAGVNSNVAKIGGTEYGTLQEAINAASDGDVIEIIGTLNETNVSIDNKIVFLKNLPDTVNVGAECEVSSTNPSNTGVMYGDLEKAVKYVDEHGNTGFTHPESAGWENNIFFFIKKDIKLTENVVLPPHGNTNSVLYYDVSHGCTQFNLDLNGYEISQKRGGVGGYWWSSIDVFDGAELTIDDTSTAKTGKISGIASCIVMDNGGKVTLNGGTLSEIGDADYDGNGIVKVRGSSRFVMNGGTVNGSAATSLLRAAFEYTNAGGTPSVEINGGNVTMLPENCRSSNGSYKSPDGFVWHSSNDSFDFVVTGGTFDFNPSDYVATGYEAVELKEGDEGYVDGYRYKVQPKTPVAQIGDVKYFTLADAIAAVTDSTETTITILANIDETFATVGATVKEGQKVILDLVGHTVAGTSTASGYTQYIYVENGGYLTINDSSDGKTGKITYLDKYINDLTSGSGTGGAAIRSNGCLTVNAGTIENLTPDTKTNDLEAAIDMYTNAWGKAYAPADIVLNINGGVIKSNNANTVRLTSFSAAQYTTSVTVNLNGGEVYGRDDFFIQGVSEGNLNTNTLNLNGGKVYGTQAVRVMASQSTANANQTKPVKIVVKDAELTNNYYATSAKKGWEKGICIDNLSGTFEQLKSYVDIQTYVAKIGDVKYLTLAAAVAAVPTDGTKTTVTLLADIEAESESAYVTIDGGRNVELDMNGHTIAISSCNAGPFVVDGGTLELSGTGTVKNTYEAKNEKDYDGFYIVKLVTAPNSQANYSVFTQGKDVVLNGMDYVVNINKVGEQEYNYGAVANLNGKCTAKNTIVYVNGYIHNEEHAPIINFGSTAIIENKNYIAGYAVVNVADGATFTSTNNCFNIAAGELNINGGSFTGGNNVGDVAGSGGGIDYKTCCAVFVKQHNTNLPVKVNIKDGTFKAYAPFYQAVGQAPTPKPELVTLNISGGNFFSTAATEPSAVKSDDRTGFIKGGYFNKEVGNTYVASAYECVALSAENDDNYTALHEAGYTHKVILIKEKTSETTATVTYENESGQTVTEKTEFHNNTDAAVEAAKESTARATITVESGGITADIDDTVKIVAKTGETNTVTADPGYELNEKVTDTTAGTETYTATALEIGYADKAKTEGTKGSGKTETKQTDTKIVEAEISVSTAVGAIVGDVTEKTGVEVPAVIVNTAKEIAATINQGVAAKALNQGTTQKITNSGEGTGETAAKDVSVFVDTYYETQVKEDKTEQTDKSFTLDITPKYQAYATTVEVTTTTKLTDLHVGTDSAPIGEPQKLDMTDKEVKMKVKLPANFVESENDKVYVKHTKDDLSVHYYTATVEKEGDGFFAVFTNPDGFSKFEFSRESLEPPTPPTPHHGGGGVTSYTVTVESAKNGSISVDKKTASSGSTVTITVTPDKGFTLETLTVLDKNGKEIEVKNLGNNKYSFKMPSGKVTVKATFMEDNTMLNFFVDVKATDYFYDAVLWAAENDITKGTDAVHFSPSAPVTRAQAVTFLWRAAGCPKAESKLNPFTDVAADAYYYEAVLWAVENGITNGTTDTTFSPNVTCSRAHIVSFLYRYAKAAASETTNPFTDVAADAYYYEPVLWAVANGVTGGTTATTFSPANTCTRAQVVTFLYRYMVK